jgi:hypothetical protein
VAVKRLHQESENVSKASFIFGNMFGGIGVLAGNAKKIFCMPMSLRLHDGLQAIKQWLNPNRNEDEATESHIVQTIVDGFKVAKAFEKSLLTLDRYFLSVPALRKWKELTKDNAIQFEIVTKAKRNCVAYQDPEAYSGRGRPKKKGKAVKLWDLFELEKEKFTTCTLKIYGKRKNIPYHVTHLLWGKKLYQKLKFVLVEMDGTKTILVSTDLNFVAEKIIEVYSLRFKIECTFREMNQVISGFGYHFWSKYMPKLNRFKKTSETTNYQEVTSDKGKQRIIDTVKAVEGYVAVSCISLGIMQMVSLLYSEQLNGSFFRYLRTPSKEHMSERSVASYMRKSILSLYSVYGHLSITQIILRKQQECEIYKGQEAS